MKKKPCHFILPVLIILFLVGLSSCSKPDDGNGPSLSLLSSTINGTNWLDGLVDVEKHVVIEMTFSRAIDPTSFEASFTISDGSSTQFNPSYTFAAQSTRVNIEVELDYETTYVVELKNSTFGNQGESLDPDFVRQFSTKADGIIHTAPPCTTGNVTCLHQTQLAGTSSGQFEFYSSYPIYEGNAAWTNLSTALIVVHGANKNADEYFNFMMSTLQGENLADSIVLLSPYFKSQDDANFGDFYWTSTGWREGLQSISEAKISSFAAVDQLIDQLADKTHFPNLDHIIVTGHSSGALYTHLFAASNSSETRYPDIKFDYIVANSQYFYYPDERRVDESSQQLYTPTNCAGYEFWPAGFSLSPPYLTTLTESEYNDRFIERSIHYLLGNGNQMDGSLNTTACAATLLGSSRYQRGENMFLYMNMVYSGIHNHRRTIVPGIGHDGQAMYQSEAYRQLLLELVY